GASLRPGGEAMWSYRGTARIWSHSALPTGWNQRGWRGLPGALTQGREAGSVGLDDLVASGQRRLDERGARPIGEEVIASLPAVGQAGEAAVQVAELASAGAVGVRHHKVLPPCSTCRERERL